MTDELLASYDFVAFPIEQGVFGEDAVYAYAHHDGTEWVLHYIGTSGSRSLGLERDPNRETALRMGATHVLVHHPGPTAEIKCAEAMFRLVHAYKPPLNRGLRTRFVAS